MLRITVQELEAKGIQYQQATQLQLFGKCFIHEQSFSKADSELAVEYCRNELGQNRVCVLVVEPNQDSVWREASEVEALLQTKTAANGGAAYASRQGISQAATSAGTPTADSATDLDLKSLLSKLNEPIDLKALLFKKLL